MSRWGRIMVLASLVCGGCLTAPEEGLSPGNDFDPFVPDAGAAVEACAVSATFASSFHVGGEGNTLDVAGFAVIGNLGDVPVELDQLSILSVDDPRDAELQVTISGTPATLAPGEAHGRLDEQVRPMVAGEIAETWTEDEIPSLDLHFDGHRDFDVGEATVTLAVGSIELPLRMRFDTRGFGDDELEDAERATASCAAL